MAYFSSAYGGFFLTPSSSAKTSDWDGTSTPQTTPRSLLSPSPTRPKHPEKLRKTRIFVISDTHNHAFTIPKGHYDFVVCLGDHTHRSTKQEFDKFIGEIMQIDADHIFLIFGNHEYSTDTSLPKSKYPNFPEARLQAWESHLEKDYAFQLCRAHGIVLLDEGQYVFNLNNGTTAKIYASSYTPQRRKSPYIGYRYQRREHDNPSGHKFNIDSDIDLVFTHGPPEGILDVFGNKTSLRGCIDLLEAVALSRPRLHCFGHNHAGWGATFVNWEEGTGEEPLLEGKLAEQCEKASTLTKATKIDVAKGQDLASLKQNDAKSSSPLDCCRLSHCPENKLPVTKNSSTLFVNAAYEGINSNSEGEKETNMPMFVELDLPVTIKSPTGGKGVQAPMKRSPTSKSTLVSAATLISGQPGAWMPPYKRQSSPDQAPSATQATRAPDASTGSPKTPIQVSYLNSEEPMAQGVAETKGKAPYRPPGLLWLNQMQHHVKLPLRGLAECNRNGGSQVRSASWGVPNTVRHDYQPEKSSSNSASSNNRQTNRLSYAPTTSSKPATTPQTRSPMRSNQASPDRSDSVGATPRPEQCSEGPSSAKGAQQSQWRNREPDTAMRNRDDSGSRRPKTSDKRGKYGFFRQSTAARKIDDPWKERCHPEKSPAWWGSRKF